MVSLKVFLSICVCVCAAISLASCGAQSKPSQSLTENLYVFDINDPAKVVGFADYVIVGLVEKKGDTEYYCTADLSLLDGIEIENDPYTNYEIKVLENLKGNLKPEATIPVLKNGGMSEDGSRLRLEDGDFMPETGETLIICLSVRDDGTLLLSGKNDSYRLLDADHVGEDYKNLEVYKTIANACENEVFFDRERNTAPEQYLE